MSGVFRNTESDSLKYKGTWNATTNTPTLSGSGGGGISGDFYIVDVSGSTSIDGHSTWAIGDWIINDGLTWDRVEAYDAVASVAGKTGSVTLQKADLTDFVESDFAHSSGNETIAGVKTFSSIPVLPASNPTTDNQIPRKKYIDDSLTTGLAGKENSLTKGNLTGTTNQVIVSGGTGSIIGSGAGLSLPQDIATVSNPTFAGAKLTDNLVISKASGKGILVDTASPNYGWKEFIGYFIPDPGGANAPILTTFRGNVRGYAFTTNDKVELAFHLLHDYAPGTDLYAHVHWSHIGTAISGNLICSFAYTYSKGHNQTEYFAEKTLSISVSTPNIATVPQYRHRIDEIQLSSATPTANQIDSANLEVDGIIKMTMTVTTLPTITGGLTNRVFIDFIDLHYQSTQTATKNKAPNFYS